MNTSIVCETYTATGIYYMSICLTLKKSTYQNIICVCASLSLKRQRIAEAGSVPV